MLSACRQIKFIFLRLEIQVHFEHSVMTWAISTIFNHVDVAKKEMRCSDTTFGQFAETISWRC